MINLSTLLLIDSGWQYLTEARAINNYGQTVGKGTLMAVNITLFW
jgi:hypothetical protein